MSLPGVVPTDDAAEERLSEKLQGIARSGEEQRAQAHAIELGLPYVNLRELPITQNVLALMTESQARTFLVLPFHRDGQGIHVASPEPNSTALKEFLVSFSSRQRAELVIHVISASGFTEALERYRRIPEEHEKVEGGVEIRGEEIAAMSESAATFAKLRETFSNISVSDLLTLLIAGAIRGRASDIHVEAESGGIKVRYRIDGVLHDIVELPKDLWQRLISRMKLVAGLKINVDDVPQDGRFTIFYTPPSIEKIDVRISVLPTAFGESIVMRLLMASSVGVKFEDLGITGRSFELLSKEIARPNGMILTTGPTGSGKTTTLYAILTKLNTPENKIITIEDPIEYKLEGVNQSQVETERGYSFANGLKSIVRQDPDIIMVGEIRDLETADIAIQAALTGHLVLSTLHTNSASGTVPRLLSMGAKPFLLAPAINVMIAQRLVRRLCEHCKKETPLDPATLDRVQQILTTIPKGEPETKPVDSEAKLLASVGVERSLASAPPNGSFTSSLHFYTAPGCSACNSIGYHGRIGIYEVMPMSPEIEKLVLSGKTSEYDMQAIAIKEGMVTMVQDGLLKAAAGITSVEEVFRVAE